MTLESDAQGKAKTPLTRRSRREQALEELALFNAASAVAPATDASATTEDVPARGASRREMRDGGSGFKPRGALVARLAEARSWASEKWDDAPGHAGHAAAKVRSASHTVVARSRSGIAAALAGARRGRGPTTESSGSQRRGASVRTRVLVYLAVLTGVALSVAGTTAYVVERSRLDAGIESDLARQANDVIEFIAEGDPATGEPFADVETILTEAMRRVVATPTESAVALIGGTPRFVPSGSDILRLEADDEFLTAGLAAAGGDPEVRSVTTARADYRYVSIAVTDEGTGTSGVFVIAIDRGARVGALADTFQVYALVAGLSLAAIIAIGWFTVGRLLEPIRLLDETARSISRSDLSERIPIVGDDDLAHLSDTVNLMLDRIERAFDDQSRLLDDASHELRTPLTIVRNRLELLEPRDADDVETTREVLLDEVTRMSRLVDDLVTLAKADRPEFLSLGPVDLAALTELARLRATTLGSRLWVVEAQAEATIEADAQRLTQAWLQLTANAVKFSEPGTRIVLGSAIGWSADGLPEARLWVRDEGIGIAQEDIARVMDRFGRVDPAADGVGLGLPIVAAIATAHEGRLDVESTPGDGSTFTIVIPAYAPRANALDGSAE